MTDIQEDPIFHPADQEQVKNRIPHSVNHFWSRLRKYEAHSVTFRLMDLSCCQPALSVNRIMKW